MKTKEKILIFLITFSTILISIISMMGIYFYECDKNKWCSWIIFTIIFFISIFLSDLIKSNIKNISNFWNVKLNLFKNIVFLITSIIITTILTKLSI